MYNNVSAACVTALNQASRTFQSKITVNGSEVSDIKSYTLVSGSCGSEVFTIGTIFSSYVNVVLPVQEITLAGQEFFLETGVVLDNNTIEYIPMGYFTASPSDITKSRDQIMIKASDRITSKCKRGYLASVHFPASIGAIIDDIETQLGVPVLTSFPTSGIVETAFPIMSCAEALGYIAGLLGGFCFADRNGNIRIEPFPGDSALDVSKDRIYQLSINESEYTLNRLSVTVSNGGVTPEGEEEDPIIYSSGSGQGIDLFNPYMTETIFNTLAENMLGYSYYPGTVDFLGDPRLDPIDAIAAENYEDTEFVVPCMNVIQTFDGGLKTTVIAPGIVSSDELAQGPLTQQVESLETDMSLTKKAVDVAKASAISATHSANSALVQLSVVEDVAGTLNWISEHGSFEPTTDTTVQSGTVYFIYQGGDYVPIAQPDPSANPSEEGWYVLDVTDSQASYIMSHLAVTNAGLWILPVDRNVQYDLADSGGYQLVDSDGNQIVTYSPEPNNAPGYKVLLANNGMSIYNDQGAVVANYGVTITLGEDGRPRLRINSTGMVLLSASDSEVFEIRPDQIDYTLKEATVVTYQSDSSVTATSYTISDTSTTTSEAPYIELSVNGGEPFSFSTGVTAVATQGVGVTVTVTSTGVAAILDEMRYETTVDTYTLSSDTTVDTTKTYYSKDGDIYTAVIPVGDEDPSAEGWYELTSTTTTAYYPCTMTVTYSAVSDIRTAIMDMIGKIDVSGAGNLIRAINTDWDDTHLDTFIRAINNTTGTSVAFGVGSGGYNHGVWSTTMGSWIIYAGQDGRVKIPKVAIVGGTGDYSGTTTGTRISAGIIQLSRTGGSSYLQVRSGKHILSLETTSAGTKGLYDSTLKKWLIYSPSGGGVRIPQNLRCSDYYRQDGTAIYRQYIYNNISRFGYGSAAEPLRMVTKYTSTPTGDQGLSFMIGNGTYAVGGSGSISATDARMYLCGGSDSTRFLQSYTVYSRTYPNTSANVYVDSSGKLGRITSSSIRYKHDVEYLSNEENATIDEEKKLTKKRKGEEEDLSSILDIPIVKFKFNEGYITGEKDFDYEKPIVGLIADDVAKIAPDCATYIEDEKGEKIPEAWNADQLLVRMLYVVQQQEKRIQELEERVKALEGGAYVK